MHVTLLCVGHAHVQMSIIMYHSDNILLEKLDIIMQNEGYLVRYTGVF